MITLHQDPSLFEEINRKARGLLACGYSFEEIRKLLEGKLVAAQLHLQHVYRDAQEQARTSTGMQKEHWDAMAYNALTELQHPLLTGRITAGFEMWAGPPKDEV